MLKHCFHVFKRPCLNTLKQVVFLSHLHPPYCKLGHIFACLVFAVTASFAVAALVLPENFEHYLNLVKALEIPSWIIFSGKTVLAWPLSYHAFNGIRHLV